MKEKKAGKIEIISQDHDINLHESHISLYPITHNNDGKALEEQGWALYAGAISSIDNKTPAPIKKSTHLLKLLCWGFFNRVISGGRK